MILNKKLRGSMISYNPVSERILVVRLAMRPVNVTVVVVWNTLTVLMIVSTTIPLHQDPLDVDVAGLQGMQCVGTLQQCALWSGGSLRMGKQVMRSRPIGGEIRRIWPGHILDDSV